MGGSFSSPSTIQPFKAYWLKKIQQRSFYVKLGRFHWSLSEVFCLEAEPDIALVLEKKTASFVHSSFVSKSFCACSAKK